VQKWRTLVPFLAQIKVRFCRFSQKIIIIFYKSDVLIFMASFPGEAVVIELRNQEDYSTPLYHWTQLFRHK
jgi:hypothetical protein